MKMQNLKKQKRKHQIIIAVVAILLFITIILVVILFIKSKPLSSQVTPESVVSSRTESIVISSSAHEINSQAEKPVLEIKSGAETTVLPKGKLSDWNLILLNHGENNKIDAELDITKIKFDSQFVDDRAAKAYKSMYNAAQLENITLFLRSGYRSLKTQQENYNASIKRELKKGSSNEEATRLTKQYYTVPGHSEHHTGLAFDIITPQYHKNVYNLDERFADTDAYSWLVANCAQYGFILRYPKDKIDITKINFEPWHYRYVGVEHAKYMTANSLCLEEYITLLAEHAVD